MIQIYQFYVHMFSQSYWQAIVTLLANLPPGMFLFVKGFYYLQRITFCIKQKLPCSYYYTYNLQCEGMDMRLQEINWYHITTCATYNRTFKCDNWLQIW